MFQDFVEMTALALSNAVDLFQRATREERYHQIIQRYTPEELQQFPALVGLLIAALEDELADVLGALYHRLEIHNEQSGQFFTPYPVCMAMAKTLMHDAKRLAEEQGFIRALEPCIGSGAMVIALAQACREVGVHYQQELHVTAVDLDATAVHMAYVQLFFLHIPAVVVYGDTLRQKEHARWYTAAHILNGWNWRLQRAGRREVQSVVPPPPASDVSLPPPPLAVPVGTQLTLF